MHNIPRTRSSKALRTFLTFSIQVLFLLTVTTVGSSIPTDRYISYMQRQLYISLWSSILYPKPYTLSNTFQLSLRTTSFTLLTSPMGVLRTVSGPQLCWSTKLKPESKLTWLLTKESVTSYTSNSSTYISRHYLPKSVFEWFCCFGGFFG